LKAWSNISCIETTGIGHSLITQLLNINLLDTLAQNVHKDVFHRPDWGMSDQTGRIWL